MCGIVGYYNYNVPRDLRFILDVLLGGLKRLEYRGYDSAGVCIDGVDALPGAAPVIASSAVVEAGGAVAANGGAAAQSLPHVIKCEGKIEALERLAAEYLGERGAALGAPLRCHVGIAHTRWATHGAPSAVNSHPQVSDPGCDFVVVHNGIITNFKALKEILVREL
jgi:glucosamine--fructose-6-phosphate aminotransferase (isomerizing)